MISFIGRSDNCFNDLCCRQSPNINDCLAAHVVSCLVPSKIIKRRLFELFNHPMIVGT